MIVVRCPAKVNLHLQVLGKRPDGYHELRTLYQAVGLWDQLAGELAPEGLELRCEPPQLIPPEENLVVKAGRLLQERFGCSKGARLFLQKSIPLGGGLGGGSANAAAALSLLARLWGLPADFEHLYPLARQLGADVPFFLLGGTAWGVGRGEEVLPLPDLPRFWVLLWPFSHAVSTPEVYAALSAAPMAPWEGGPVYHWLVEGGELPFSACTNDLEPAVVQRLPTLGERLSWLRRQGPLLAQLSGSGGTVFAVFRRRREARAVQRLLGAEPTWVVPFLGRSQSQLCPPAGRGGDDGNN